MLLQNINQQGVVSLMFYMALDGQGSLQPHVEGDHLKSISGYSEELGQFRMIFPKYVNKTHPTRLKYHHLVSYAGTVDVCNGEAVSYMSS